MANFEVNLILGITIINHMNRNALLTLVCLFFATIVFSQNKYVTRTAHVSVQSTNKVMDIEADNYQVASVLDINTGRVDFIGLLKSFEFKLGAADQLFNSKMVDVSKYPNIKFTGQIQDFQKINFTSPGTHTIEVKGNLYIWDEKRVTSAKGKITINADGSIKASSVFDMVIEDGSVNKVNDLMKEKLPSAMTIDVNKLGISKTIKVRCEMTYQKRNAIAKSRT